MNLAHPRHSHPSDRAPEVPVDLPSDIITAATDDWLARL